MNSASINRPIKHMHTHVSFLHACKHTRRLPLPAATVRTHVYKAARSNQAVWGLSGRPLCPFCFLFEMGELFLAGSGWRLECVQVHGSFERAGVNGWLALAWFLNRKWRVACRMMNRWAVFCDLLKCDKNDHFYLFILNWHFGMSVQRNLTIFRLKSWKVVNFFLHDWVVD